MLHEAGVERGGLLMPTFYLWQDPMRGVGVARVIIINHKSNSAWLVRLVKNKVVPLLSTMSVLCYI